MKIRTRQEVEAFQEAVDQCSNVVWLTSPEGKQYNLKSDAEFYQGVARLMGDESDDMELFASNHTDEAVMMNFYRRLTA